MRRRLDQKLSPLPNLAVPVRHPAPGDAEELARLMFDAYRGSIDFEPTDTIDVAREEVDALFDGRDGPLMPGASFLALEGKEAISASLIIRYEGAAFVAFTMTCARCKGQGMARALLTRSLYALASSGESQVDLEVTAGNAPAEHLYRSLGFEVLDR